MPLLSVIVPVYNESATIREIISSIQGLDIDKEIIVINDGSSDGTEKILHEIQGRSLKIIHHSTNRGKGAAFLTGLANASGEFLIIQDADLEYDPQDYYRLIKGIESGRWDMVLGARFLEGHHGLFIHRVGNKLLSGLLNLIFRSHLNDYATCYKLARRAVFDNLNLSATGFDIDVEIVCNALKRKLRLLEVPVSYNPRTYREGKKIRWKHGLWAVFYMFKYRFHD